MIFHECLPLVYMPSVGRFGSVSLLRARECYFETQTTQTAFFFLFTLFTLSRTGGVTTNMKLPVRDVLFGRIRSRVSETISTVAAAAANATVAAAAAISSSETFLFWRANYISF